jgi:hypothetical protein
MIITKEEVELIIFKVSADGQDAINMKIYKDGTTCRDGVGGLPQLNISAMSFFYDTRYFDPLIEKVPQEILDNSINHEEETPNGYLEYVIAFYGVSSNGITGERANWTKSTGVRVKLDKLSKFNHPIMGLLEGLTIDAAELTNEWYFDAMMQVIYKAKSSTLPKQTILTSPKTDKEIKTNFENYISQMLQSVRKWDMTKFVENKTYEIDGKKTNGIVKQVNNWFSVSFHPVFVEEVKVDKPKWKFW